MLPIRCSGSVRPGARKSVRTCGSSPDGGSRRSMTGGVGGADSDGRRQRSSSVPSARVRVAPGASCSAVCGETAISPAIAADSVSIVAVTSAPTTTSSRWLEPTRKNGNSAEWRPTDIVSSSRPMALGVRLLSRMLRRISTAADAARVACPSPWNRNSSASPPNLRSIPPRASAMSSIAPNTALSVSTSASAPTRPCRTSRSVSAVNPEMSAKHNVPSTNRVRGPSPSLAIAAARADTCRSMPNPSSWPHSTATASILAPATRIARVRCRRLSGAAARPSARRRRRRGRPGPWDGRTTRWPARIGRPASPYRARSMASTARRWAPTMCTGRISLIARRGTRVHRDATTATGATRRRPSVIVRRGRRR